MIQEKECGITKNYTHMIVSCRTKRKKLILHLNILNIEKGQLYAGKQITE